VLARVVVGLCLVALAGGAASLYAVRPEPLPLDALAGLSGDAGRGARVFLAGGCASCHADSNAEGEARLILRGGQRFASPFGTFVAPNISSDPVNGIGDWSALDLANAMLRGVSPEGQHYYPVFPYASYSRVTLQDVVDLHAYLVTLPSDPAPSQPHEVPFPFSVRAGLGLWKALYLDRAWVVGDELSETETRGRYLVEGLGHCAECHTPRDSLGGIRRALWLSGAPTPDGKGRVPNITPGKLDWSEADIAEYLSSGFTPDFDSAGGHMVLVIENTSGLPPEDRAAIAAYLKRVPALP